MKKYEFDKILDEDKKFRGYLFWGEDNFLIESYAKKVIYQFNLNDDEILKVYFDEYKIDNIVDFLSQNSLFCPINLALIKTNKKIYKKDIDKILQICKTNENSVVIFAILDNVDMRQIESVFREKFASVRFFKPNINEAISILSAFANKLKIKIDQFALSHLYNMQHQDLSLCVKELEKLSILDQEITSKTIDNYCFGLGSVDINEMIFKLFEKKDIKKDLNYLIEEGFNEIVLLRQITDFVIILLKIISYSKIYGKIDIKGVWGYNLPQFIAQKYINLAFRFKDKVLIKILNYLLELELELKSGIIKDTKNYFFAKIINLM